MPEGEEEEQEIKNLFAKIMKENFPNLVKEIDMQVHEAQWVPNKMDAKRPSLRHISIKRSKGKDKERLLKAAREKKLVTRWWPDGNGEGRMGEEVRGLRSTISSYKIDMGMKSIV